MRFELIVKHSVAVLTTVLFLAVFTHGRELDERKGSPDLSGTWVLQSGDADITLVIEQVGAEIRVTRNVKRSGSVETLDTIYYCDERGEVNPAEGNKTLKSATKWKGEKLIVRFSLPQTRSGNYPVVNERVDEWVISADRKTLTQTSTLTSRSAQTDASANPHSSPRFPDMLATPLRRTEKRVFKRVA